MSIFEVAGAVIELCGPWRPQARAVLGLQLSWAVPLALHCPPSLASRDQPRKFLGGKPLSSIFTPPIGRVPACLASVAAVSTGGLEPTTSRLRALRCTDCARRAAGYLWGSQGFTQLCGPWVLSPPPKGPQPREILRGGGLFHLHSGRTPGP